MITPILPGSVLGVLGSGQLGRMFAIAARRMGYRVHTYSPETDTPTGQVADKEWTASFDDVASLSSFAKSVDLITFEFENIPVDAVKAAEKWAPVHPGGHVLHTTQNRLREKTFLSKNGFPVPPFMPISSEAELKAAAVKIGAPAVLKSAGFGYDGKGQKKIETAADLPAAYESIGRIESILEAFVPFERELSVVAARGKDGSFIAYDVFENEHRNHILDVTVSPARISEKLKKQAMEMARGIFEALEVVGVLCVEMFLTKNESLLVNELAPRPHNSGHLTFDACVTSQFEQQLRAVCGLPLGAVDLMRPAAMANLLGDLWKDGEPDWARAIAYPSVKLHLYGKASARPGRKMGHLTALGASVEEAVRQVKSARESLVSRKPVS